MRAVRAEAAGVIWHVLDRCLSAAQRAGWLTDSVYAVPLARGGVIHVQAWSRHDAEAVAMGAGLSVAAAEPVAVEVGRDGTVAGCECLRCAQLRAHRAGRWVRAKP